MPLTDTACKKATCPEGRPSVRLADEKALYLEVTAAGGKYWRWKYTCDVKLVVVVRKLNNQIEVRMF